MRIWDYIQDRRKTDTIELTDPILYQVIKLWHWEHRTVQEIQEELGLSIQETQVYLNVYKKYSQYICF